MTRPIVALHGRENRRFRLLSCGKKETARSEQKRDTRREWSSGRKGRSIEEISFTEKARERAVHFQKKELGGVSELKEKHRTAFKGGKIP